MLDDARRARFIPPRDSVLADLKETSLRPAFDETPQDMVAYPACACPCVSDTP